MVVKLFFYLMNKNFHFFLSYRDDAQLDLRYIFEGHALGVVSVDINHEGKIAASCSLDSHILFWNLESGTQVQSIDVGPVDAWTVAFSPDSKYISSGSHSGRVNLYNVETGKLEKQLDTPGKFTISIAWVSYFSTLIKRTQKIFYK